MSQPTPPRLLRINLLAERVRPLLADVDAWRAAHPEQPLRFSGVLNGHYARLYLAAERQPLPDDLIALLLPNIREHSGSIASVGAWIVELEVAPVLDEQTLFTACEVA